MNWKDKPIPNDDEGRPMFNGNMVLTNDKGEFLANVLWFFDGGPYYSFALDPADTDIVRRIGPSETLEGAKASAIRALQGEIKDLSKRAGFRKDE